MLKKRGILVHPEDLTDKWILCMADAGLNNLGLHPVGGRLAHESLQRAVDTHILPESRRLRALAKEKGINVEYEAHAMGWLMPRHIFSEHPEWFRMNEKGERVADFNMCASNPEALEYLAERTALLARLTETGSDKYYLWTDDVSGFSCHCPMCRSLSPSDQQLALVNAMLKGLRRYKKDAKLCYLAYHDALAVPEKVEPEEGVFLEFAPIGRDHHRPINDPDCDKNRDEIRDLKKLMDFFGKKDSRVLEYWMDNSKFSNWTKPPKRFTLDAGVMERDAEFYASMGFEEMTSFGCYLGPDYEELFGEASLTEYGRILSKV